MKIEQNYQSLDSHNKKIEQKNIFLAFLAPKIILTTSVIYFSTFLISKYIIKATILPTDKNLEALIFTSIVLFSSFFLNATLGSILITMKYLIDRKKKKNIENFIKSSDDIWESNLLDIQDIEKFDSSDSDKEY